MMKKLKEEDGPFECEKCGELTWDESGVCERCQHVNELEQEDELMDGGGHIRIRQK